MFHNAKFDIRSLGSIEVCVDWSRYEDTLLASHAVCSTDNHGLKELSVKYLAYSDTDELRLQKAVMAARREAKKLGWTLGEDEKGKAQVTWDYWMVGLLDPTNVAMQTYAMADVERTMLLWGLYKEILVEDDLWKGYCEEKELQRVVYRVENCGLSVSKSKIESTATFLTRERELHLEKVRFVSRKCLGKELNTESGDDIREVLYKDFALPIPKRTETGLESINKDTLKILYEQTEENTYEHKLLKHLLTSKAYISGARYLKGYSQLLHDRDALWGVLYTSLNQIGAATNRFTSSNPNGQNVGKKNKYKVGDSEIVVPKMRDVFGPMPGKIWYSIDYSQIELRVFAAVSNEQALIDALEAGYDFHGYVASRIFNKELGQVSDQERTIAKNVNFALIFGASEAKVNATAGIPNAYSLFSTQFPNASRFMARVIDDVRVNGCVRCMDGYRLSVPTDSPHKGVNYMVQGSAGRILKYAMRSIDKYIDWDKFKMILQVHDELIFEVDVDSEYNSAPYLRSIMDIMESAGDTFGLKCPVSLEIIDTDWGHGRECIDVTNEFILAT